MEKLDKLIPLHQKKTPPGPYDWLANHPEEGQTFEQYKGSHPVLPDAQRKIIYITLLGDFDKTRQEIVEKTAEYMKAYFQLPVKFADPIPLKSVPVSARRFHPTGMGFSLSKQVLTTYVIEDLLIPRLPKDAFCLIAFTAVDLWPGEGWNFVFGQASMTDRVGVWSINRNGDPGKSKEEYDLCLKRTIQTGVHEVGHMFSLYHCIFYECLMNGSNHRQEADSRPLWLCPVCLKKVCWALKINPVKRFEDLAKISEAYGFTKEKEFFQKSIAVLTQGEPKHE